jgi:hypothetical protein
MVKELKRIKEELSIKEREAPGKKWLNKLLMKLKILYTYEIINTIINSGI